jgi:hypothetical protein
LREVACKGVINSARKARTWARLHVLWKSLPSEAAVHRRHLRQFRARRHQSRSPNDSGSRNGLVEPGPMVKSTLCSQNIVAAAVFAHAEPTVAAAVVVAGAVAAIDRTVA